MRPPPIDCCVFPMFPAATPRAQTSSPLARGPTMSWNPGTSSTSRSSRLVVVLLLAVMLPHLENPKIEMRPFSPHFSPASSSPIDPYRHWKRSDMVRRASVSATDRGGAMRPCRLIVILALWPILSVLSLLTGSCNLVCNVICSRAFWTKKEPENGSSDLKNVETDPKS